MSSSRCFQRMTGRPACGRRKVIHKATSVLAGAAFNAPSSRESKLLHLEEQTSTVYQ